MKYCALCCIACDEDRFLGEWLAYHAVVGFEHFIIYDDCSAVPISDLLGGRPDPLVSLEVWTLRAEAAMRDGCDELVRFCLDKAMEYGASKEAHTVLARWMLGKGRREASRQALRILGAYGVR